MTPREKAKDLVDKFSKHADTYHNVNHENSKNCALIAVEEMINAQKACYVKLEPYYIISDQYLYLLHIKQEIEKL